jgi:hypothetical protein
VSPADDWSNLTDNFVQMKKKQVDIFGFVETKVAWTPTAQNERRRHGKGIFEHFNQVTASSDDPTVGYRQPGGTLMATTGKFVGRVARSETDTYGLRRWCYTCLSGRYSKLNTL